MIRPEECELRPDQKSLLDVYEKWPRYFYEANVIKCATDKSPDKYNSLFLCGMGGSATACDLLNDMIQLYGTIASNVVRGFSLPSRANKDSLVIINSVSGNTQEALAMAKEARDRSCEIICISSGGKILEFAESNCVNHIKIPSLSLPRASLPYMIMPGLKLIAPFLQGFNVEEITNIPKRLSYYAKMIRMDKPLENNPSKKIASFILNGFSFCFTSPYLLGVGTRFKNSINENAKLHCSRDSILESTHNEIVPFTYMGNGFQRKVIFVKWMRDDVFVKQRFDKVQSLFSQIGQPWIDISSREESLITAMLHLIYVLDYSTVFMSILKGLDPSPTPAIDILKKI